MVPEDTRYCRKSQSSPTGGPLDSSSILAQYASHTWRGASSAGVGGIPVFPAPPPACRLRERFSGASAGAGAAAATTTTTTPTTTTATAAAPTPAILGAVQRRRTIFLSLWSPTELKKEETSKIIHVVLPIRRRRRERPGLGLCVAQPPDPPPSPPGIRRADDPRAHGPARRPAVRSAPRHVDRAPAVQAIPRPVPPHSGTARRPQRPARAAAAYAHGRL